MEHLKMLLSVLLLCACVHMTVGGEGWQKWVCENGGKPSMIRPFSKVYHPRLFLNLPCKYKMANVKCKGDQTEVFAENGLANTWERDIYVRGVTVRITTNNDNGCKTYQTLTLNSDTFKQFMDRGNFSDSPWEWSSSGCPIDASKKNVGFISGRVAKVTVGRLTISYQYTTSTTRRKNHIPTLEIRCVGYKFKSFENYPESLCGTANTTEEELEAVMQQVPGDSLRHRGHTRDMYAALVKQKDVQQTDPQCQDIQNLVQGRCRNVGDHNFECSGIMGGWGYSGSRSGRCDGTGENRFKVYLMCMRMRCGILCDSPNTTCDFLTQHAKQCEASYIGGKLNDLLVRANCPRHVKYRLDYSARRGFSPWLIPKRKECIVKDRAIKAWGRTLYRDIHTFFSSSGVQINIPCRYKMAHVECNGVTTAVYADHSLDSAGRTYISELTVQVTVFYDATYNYRSYRDNDYYTSTLKNIQLKRYIKSKGYENNTDPWSVSWRGGKLSGDERVVGSFDQRSQSAVVKHRGLTVTYRYTDPTNPTRPDHAALDIRCTDPNFNAVQKFPATICGSPGGQNLPVEDLTKDIPADPFHTHYNKDLVILSYQRGKSGTGPACKEGLRILKKGCVNMGDVLTECSLLYSMTSSRINYAQCAWRKERLDPFKLYVTCLRVLCEAENFTSRETCDTLKVVNDACEREVKHPHMHISRLLEKAKCTQNATANK